MDFPSHDALAADSLGAYGQPGATDLTQTQATTDSYDGYQQNYDYGSEGGVGAKAAGDGDKVEEGGEGATKVDFFDMVQMKSAYPKVSLNLLGNLHQLKVIHVPMDDEEGGATD